MAGTDSISFTFAISGIIYILIVLICIALSWWGLQQFRFDLFVKNPRSIQSKLLQIFLSLALGYQVARFIIDYFNWSAMIKGLF